MHVFFFLRLSYGNQERAGISHRQAFLPPPFVQYFAWPWRLTFVHILWCVLLPFFNFRVSYIFYSEWLSLPRDFWMMRYGGERKAVGDCMYCMYINRADEPKIFSIHSHPSGWKNLEVKVRETISIWWHAFSPLRRGLRGAKPNSLLWPLLLSSFPLHSNICLG